MLSKKELKNLVKTCIAEVITEEQFPSSGVNKNSAMPAGSQVFEATIRVSGNEMVIQTRKGHLTLILTPEQVATIRDEADVISEESQPEPYDDETDTFAPGPRDRTEPVPTNQPKPNTTVNNAS